MQIHITNTINPEFGGEGVAAHGLSKALSSYDIKVVLVTLANKKSKTDFNDKKNDYTIIYLKNFFIVFKLIKNLFQIINILKKYKPEVVHIHGMWTMLLTFAAFICIFRKIKFIISPHGCLEPWALNHKFFKKKIAMIIYQKFILRKASCIIVNSDMERINAKKANVSSVFAIIPNGISYIPKKINTFNEYRKIHKDSNKYLLFFSRLHEKKGVDNLLEAWSKCNVKNWTLKIIGPGNKKYVNYLNKLIEEYKIKNNVILKEGFVQEKLKINLFKNATAFILPTKSENFGIVVIEALSFQLPVITTKEAPWHEISEFNCGWWVDANVNALANSINELINSSDKSFYDMGTRGYNLVKENYTWKKKGKQAKELHLWLIGKSHNKPVFVY